MMRMIAVLLTVFGLLASGPALAEKRMALVIGNGAYAVGPLANPTNDSQLVAGSLEWAGFEVTHVQDLDYRSLQRAVIDFGRDLKDAGEDTVGLVFYAGHAIQANGENYLIPVDSDIQDELDLDIQALPVSILMRSLETAGNRLNMVVLDACRNNPFAAMNRSGTRGLAKIDAPFGTLLAYSTAPGDVATDGEGRNSPYSAALAKAIQVPGLPVEQLFKRVRVDVMERTGNRQVPWESSSLIGDFYFTPGVQTVQPDQPAVTPDSGDDAEIAYWKSIATSGNPLDFQGYLAAYPNGTFKDVAEQRIAALQSTQDEQAARQAWDAVKNSGDAAAIQDIANRYPGTVYAEMAQIKLQSLVQASELSTDSNDQASLARGETERLFWESIKDSTNPTDYEAYLQRYPNGSFSAIARIRLDGDGMQVASRHPVVTHPMDGAWTLDWKVTGSYWQGNWCTAGEQGSETFEIQEGEYSGTILSNRSRTGRFSVEVSEDGAAILTIGASDWPIRKNRLRVDLASGSGSVSFPGMSYCAAELTLTRLQ